MGSCEVEPAEIPASWAERYPHRLPAARLSRLATDRRFVRRGYGTHLLVDMLWRVAEAGRNVGFVGLFVDAKTDELSKWYAAFGFVRLTQRPLTLFMPLDYRGRIESGVGEQGKMRGRVENSRAFCEPLKV